MTVWKWLERGGHSRELTPVPRCAVVDKRIGIAGAIDDGLNASKVIQLVLFGGIAVFLGFISFALAGQTGYGS